MVWIPWTQNKQKVVQFIQGVIILALEGFSDMVVKNGCYKMAKIANEGSESCSLSSNMGNWWIEGRWKGKFVSNGILKYVEFWKLGMSKDDLYAKVMDPYVKY